MELLNQMLLEQEVVKGLTQIAKDLLEPNFNVKKIYTKQDRRDYISKFPKASTPNTNAKAIKPWQPGLTPSTTAPKITKPKPNPKDQEIN